MVKSKDFTMAFKNWGEKDLEPLQPLLYHPTPMAYVTILMPKISEKFLYRISKAHFVRVLYLIAES